MKTVLMLYLPAIDSNWVDFLRKSSKDYGLKAIYILGNGLVSEYLEKHPKLPKPIVPEVMKKIVEALKFFEKVEILDKKSLEHVRKDEFNIVSVNEEVSIAVIEKYFSREKHLISFEKIKN